MGLWLGLGLVAPSLGELAEIVEVSFVDELLHVHHDSAIQIQLSVNKLTYNP